MRFSFRDCMLCVCFTCLSMFGQDKVELTLPESIKMAQEQSPESQAARHTFRAAYWNYRFFLANYKPSVILSSSQELNREIAPITQSDGTQVFREKNQLSAELKMTVNQNIAWTGGTVFLKSGTKRMDILGNKTTSYYSYPIVVGYSQSLFGYNSLKWERRIEPVRYREARKNYAESLELVAARTCQLFFSMATAQANLDIAQFNYSTADTLFTYATGRYQIGTITENEMLQLEITKLTEETNRINASIEVDNARQKLLTFLGLPSDCMIEVIPGDTIPDFEIPVEAALQMALANSPDIESLNRSKLTVESNLSQARANASLKADIYMEFGLSQTAGRFNDSYQNLLDQQYVSVGLSFPLLDWGRGRGKVRVARSNRDLVTTQIEQRMNDFRLNVQNSVKQFNLQAYRVKVAEKTARTAARRFEVARRLYVLGKSTLLDLNTSINDKDAARRNYISTLNTYWSLYYTLRSLTQYDFEKNLKIEESIHFEM